jgi:hypothetical protein
MSTSDQHQPVRSCASCGQPVKSSLHGRCEDCENGTGPRRFRTTPEQLRRKFRAYEARWYGQGHGYESKGR